MAPHLVYFEIENAVSHRTANNIFKRPRDEVQEIHQYVIPNKVC